MTSKIHFHGLNGLRFYAAMSVVVQHIMSSPNNWYGDPLLPDTFGRLFLSGGDHVNLFFVLSGFLIVYLLLKEREKDGTISVHKFYLRRILRIWPLYFLIVGLAVFIMPLLVHPSLFINPTANPALLLLILFFLANFALIPYYPYPLEHLWSIAVEEQFYVVVPHLLRMKISLFRLLIGFLILYAALRLIAMSVLHPLFDNILALMRYDCIAIGGLFACAYYYRSPILRWIYHPLIGYVALTIFAIMAIFLDVGLFGSFFYTTATCFVFGILILNISTNERFALKLNHPLLEYGGKLSYGIYMYHPLILLLYRAAFFGKMDDNLYQFLIYPVVIGSTLITAAWSYKYFEQIFLNLKVRFSPMLLKMPVEDHSEQKL